jgi:MerR family transcriptional regulator/heat shock protein HspR
MDEQYVTRIVFQQHRPSLFYSERETATASYLNIGTLRRLHALGLIEGKEIDGEQRYSEEEIIQLRRIRRLQHELGVNLAGVEVVLHLLGQLETISQELEQEKKRKNNNEI